MQQNNDTQSTLIQIDSEKLFNEEKKSFARALTYLQFFSRFFVSLTFTMLTHEVEFHIP